VTIIWAPQSGTSAKSVNHRVRAPRTVGGPTWSCGGALWAPPAESGRSPGRQRFFVYTDKIWANFWPPMRKHTAAQRRKSGQIRDTKPKMGQMGVRGELWFFPGTIC